MRTLGLAALVVVALGSAALASPAVAAALGRTASIGRVFDRVFEVVLGVGLVLAWRRLDLGDAAALGLRGASRARAFGRGVFAGVLGLGVALGAAYAGGALSPALRYPAAKTLHKAALGLGAAGLLGVGEEILFRGILLRRLRADLGPVPGLLVTTLIYSVVHVLRAGAGGGGDWAGLMRLRALFLPLVDPVVVPAVAGLFGLGLLLAWLRLASGGLWLPIGVHVAWVAVFRVGRLFFDLRRSPAWLVGPGWPPLIGGAAGGLALATTALLLRRSFCLSGPARRVLEPADRPAVPSRGEYR